MVLSDDTTLSRPVQDYLAGVVAQPGGSVLAVGGQAASAVDNSFGCASTQVTCLIGADRYQTAVRVAENWFGGTTVYGLTTGQNFPDALAAAPALGARDWPLLLVPTDGPLPSSVLEYLRSNQTSLTDGLIAGGTAAVGGSVAGDSCSAATITRCDVTS